MRHAFEYEGPEGDPFHVPEGTAVLTAARRSAPGRHDVLDEAMRAPVGVRPLDEVVARDDRVLLLVDDATRQTPVADMLRPVSEALASAGVPDANVRVLTAPGTHRPLTGAELDQKLGAYRGRWAVEQHDWTDHERLVDLGRTTAGMPVVVNRALQEADHVVGLGHVGVHAIMGFSGGAKIVLPGVAGPAACAWTHWAATRYRQEDLLGVEESPVRRSIEEGARMAGLGAVFNVAMDAQGNVQAARYGDPVAAQRELVPVARGLHAAHLAHPVDIVVTDSRPADRDLWQSAKGLYCAAVAVREGGVVVLTSPNPEGVARNHPELVHLVGLEPGEIEARVAAGGVDDVMAAAVAHYLARIRMRSVVFLVSSGISDDEAHAMGFRRFASTQDAVDAARARVGWDAEVAILDGAGALLPRVGGRNAPVSAGAARASREVQR